jgi:hypothetical protein
MTPPADTERYKNHRFPGEIISHGVWLYYRFTLRHGAEIMSCFMVACIFALAPQHFSVRLTHSLKHLSA